MFVWDFDAIFAVALILGVGLVLALWIRYNLKRTDGYTDIKVSERLKHCLYCGYVYVDFYSNARRCPRCSSYH